MKENNEIVNAKTKENKIQEVKQAIAKVAEKKSYKLGDEVKAYGKNCKIVEVLESNRFHVKNLDSPFDSFIVLENEIGVEVQKDEHAPDSMVRKDNRFSL